MWENNDYTLQFQRNPFYRHEQAILRSAAFEGFLPMSFLRTEQGVTARYEASGFIPLSAFRIERTEDALYLMERVLLILHRAPEHLLAPERLLIRTQTVFYSKDGDRLRMAFVPRPQDPAATSSPEKKVPVTVFHRELILFLAQMNQDIRDGQGSFLTRFARELYYRSPDTGAMLRRIGLLRRELEKA